MVRAPRQKTSASDEHRFYELGSKAFEHFARALHETQEKILGTHLYGPDGQAQFGIDHIAFYKDQNGSAVEVGQSKAERRFTAGDLEAVAKAFLDHWDDHWKDKNVRKFVLFVGCAIKSREATDKIIELTNRFAQHGIDFAVWDSNGIYDRLRGAPAVVRAHLGQDWYTQLFGEPVGPLTGLHRELQTGDLGALRVQGYVARLNQAETGEISEWRRRIRRGEERAVEAELRFALYESPASAATAPAVRAQQLRLFAGMMLPHGDPAKIKSILDEADSLDGSSDRLRAVLLLESVGPQAALDSMGATDQAEIAEVRAVAQLRLGRSALARAELATYAENPEAGAETLRLSALAALLDNDRMSAVELAERSVSRDPDARACAQVLAIALFHRALSPAAEIAIGEWPMPVEQPMVLIGDDARSDLERAAAILARLMQDETLAEHGSTVAWHAAILACMPWRHQETQLRFFELQQEGKLPLALIVWAISRALDIDWEKAGEQCGAQIASDPVDHEAVIIRVALASFRGERKLAAEVLEAHRASLEAAGHADLVRYWSGVLAVEARKPVSEDLLNENPWLRLRIALQNHDRKKRLRSLSHLLDAQLVGRGDARVILACAQLLLEGGWHKSAVKASEFLIEKLGSAEAVAVAAHSYYRVGDYRSALEALGHVTAFPGSVLPAELEVIRIQCLAGVGEMREARDASLAIARTSGKANDLWRAIEFNISVGAVPQALALYDEHADALSEKASPGQVLLARAVLRSDPEAAARITRQLAQDTPDELVTATFELAAKLRLADEQKALIARIQHLGSENSGGVQMVDIDDVKRMMEARRDHVERAFETYANGHAPVHALAGFRQAALALSYLSPLLPKPSPATQMPLLSARYGRRFDEGLWASDPSDITIVIDTTALLTAHGLDLLDKIERTFGQVMIAADCMALLIELRNDLEITQPERLDAQRTVVDRARRGTISSISPADEINPYQVLWEAQVGDPESTLSISRLFEIATSDMAAEERDQLRDEMGNLLEDPAIGVAPAAGSHLVLDLGMAESFQVVGFLDLVQAMFRVVLAEDEVASVQREIAEAEGRIDVAASLDKLIARLGRGLEDGAYKTTAVRPSKETALLRRCFMQVLEAVRAGGTTIGWVDDRFTSSIDNPAFHIVTTIEIIAALEAFGRLTSAQAFELRQRLRQASWMFFPLEAAEIVHFVRNATRSGDVVETSDTEILRRNIGQLLLHRRRLQWPDPQSAENGAKGEIPLLLDIGHAITGALAQIWEDHSWSEDDAVAASTWIMDSLDINLYPMPVLAPGDPRSDYLIGLHWASLILTGIQIDPGRFSSSRRRAYYAWLWDTLLAHALRSRPEAWPSMEDMLVGYLIRDPADEGPKEQEIWLRLTGQTVDSMPPAVRRALLARNEIQNAYSLIGASQVNIDRHAFDEKDFWRVMASASTEPTVLESSKGEEAKFQLSDDGMEVRLTIAGETFSLDPWPSRVASDEPSVRRAALDERDDELDAPGSALDALSEELGAIRDKGARVERVLAETAKTMAQQYADRQSALAAKRPFAAVDLLPADVGAIARYLRLDASVQDAASTLIKERGVTIAIGRLGCLPISPPQVLRDAVAEMEIEGIEQLLETIEGEAPWVKLFAADILVRHPQASKLADRLKSLILSAVGPHTQPHWELFAALARYFAAYSSTFKGWTDLSPAQRLAAPWLHAGTMAPLLISGSVVIDKLVALLDDSRFVAPRFIVDPRNPELDDIGSSHHATWCRARAYAAAGCLAELRNHELHAEWAGEQLALLISSENEPVSEPRIDVSRGSLLEPNLLGSYYGDDLSAVFNAVQNSMGKLFRPEIDDMVRELLSNEAGTMEAAASWFFVRQTGVDGPMPKALGDFAREAARSQDFAAVPRDVKEARHLLLSFAAAAAANNWVEEAERIDAALEALRPSNVASDDPETHGLLLEIAFRRAMLEPDIAVRTKILGDWLSRLGEDPALRDQALIAAKHFARGLAGQHSEAFVDVIAKIFLSS